jgi:predicted RNase H-like HicB family nuclease
LGVPSRGAETLEDVTANLEDAVRTYLSALRAAGKPLPPFPIRKIEVTIP